MVDQSRLHSLLETLASIAIGFCVSLCITQVCADMGLPAHGVSPKGKGQKINGQSFASLTGWSGTSNQHERDAAMVAWPYRTAVRSA